MARERICFNAGVRRAAFERHATILRAFGFAIAAQLLLLPLLVLAGVDPFGNVDELPAIGLFPVAQVLGGLLFGVGMALAGGCIAGILWKSGAGSVATAIALAGFVVGELLIRGPGEGLVAELDAVVDPPADATLYDAAGIGFVPLALILGVALLLALRRSRAGARAGLVLGALAVLAWIAAGWAGYGYGLGFVGGPESARAAAAGGDPNLLGFQLYLGLGLIAGAALAIRGPLRLPDRARSIRAALGGLAMGVGGTVAHGCNIGNGLTGLPLLSLGSALAIVAMTVGALLTWRLTLAPSPRLRGGEHPEPDW